MAKDEGPSEGEVQEAFKKLEKEIVRGDLLEGKDRIDGRKKDAVRDIAVETGILPRTHGSALFTRGETQALVVATLGTGEDEQFVDALEGTYRERFLLHYNFPPYSVGEVGRVGFTGRREIGHGKLAWRALARKRSRRMKRSLTHCASSLKSPNPTAPPLWRPFAEHLWP